MAAASASSLKEYLKKYEAGGQDPTKKKKKKKAVKPAAAAGGVLIVDEDPVWAKPVLPDAEEEECAGEETPVVEEDIEVKRLRRLELLRSQKPYHAISEDGSGWVSISDAPKHLGFSVEAPDLSPSRQRRARFDTPSPVRRGELRPSDVGSGDLSPLRQRRRHYDSPLPESDDKPSSSCRKEVSDMFPPRRGEGGEDMSPPRRSRGFSDDLSPPRRRKKNALADQYPSKRGRKDSSGDLSPPRRESEGSSEDLSPPRRGRKGAPENLFPLGRARKASPEDPSPPQRGRKGSPQDLCSPMRGRKDSREDLSPPRKGRKGSPQDLSPPRRNKKGSLKDLSPLSRERKSLPEDLSPIKQARNQLPEVNRARASAERDLSPPRRNKRNSVESFSPPRHRQNLPGADLSSSSRKKHLLVKEERGAGLFSGREIKEEIERKKKEEMSRFMALDPALSGKGVEPIYRDKEGKRISKDELLKLQKEEEKPKEKKLEWRKGLAQKREAEARALELELEKEKPFARSRDDPELDKMLRERPRWGDPMAHLMKKKHSEPVLVDFGVDEKMKESGFIIPQAIPGHSWIKRGIDPPPNRYGILPGRHWDGVDRSNGYEKEMFKRQNEKRATETESYLWSVSDM